VSETSENVSIQLISLASRDIVLYSGQAIAIGFHSVNIPSE